jgi:L-aminopeptidase/D-esterase-like protein
MNNLLTDIAGVRVGHADDPGLASGTTAVIFDQPFVAAMDVRGGGPGTREGALLDLANTVEKIDAIALSGGSAFGLEAGGGVQAWLAERGRGFNVRGAIVPIVPGAICFDLLNGGNKKWGRFAPYRELGFAAASAATAGGFAIGSVGAGLGALTANLKGGLGSASAKTPDGVKVAALAVVNAVGTVTVGDGPWFWAAPFEVDGEYGGRGLPASFMPDMLKLRIKGGPATEAESTTLAVVVTDAALTKTQARRLAMITQTGFARAIYPVHAPMDGDVVFAVSTGERKIDPLIGLTELGMIAANVMARAIARGVHAATALPLPGALPAWRDRFG